MFIGERVRELREAYRTGPVKLDMRSFRESLSHIRRLMDSEQQRTMVAETPEQRSDYARNRSMQPVAQC